MYGEGYRGVFVFIYTLFFSKGKIGLGDAKLGALLSLVLGFDGFMIMLFIASSTGILYLLLMRGIYRMPLNRPIPFVPFLSIGSVIAYILQGTTHNLLGRLPF